MAAGLGPGSSAGSVVTADLRVAGLADGGSSAVTSPVALAAVGLVAGYRRGRRRRVVVAAERLDARVGELTAVVGPNGGGKTTLLRTLVGAQPPLEGTVEVDGRPLAALGRRDRARRLAIVLTDRVDPGRLTAGEVVALGRHPHVGWTGHLDPDDVAAARLAAEVTGVGELWDVPFEELSDGQRQRCLIARALAQEPAVMVLDEPTAFLDVPGRATLTATLQRLAHEVGLAVVVSTHDLDLALAHADQVWLVAGGGVTTGAPEDLLHDGSLAGAFTHDGLELDPVTATMRPAARPGPTIAIHGAGLPAHLAQRVAHRLGLQVTEADNHQPGSHPAPEPTWHLTVTPDGWHLRPAQARHPGTTHTPGTTSSNDTPGPRAPTEHQGTTYADLAQALRTGFAPRPVDESPMP